MEKNNVTPHRHTDDRRIGLHCKHSGCFNRIGKAEHFPQPQQPDQQSDQPSGVAVQEAADRQQPDYLESQEAADRKQSNLLDTEKAMRIRRLRPDLAHAGLDP